MGVKRIDHLSIEDYIEIEEGSQVKHEYEGGKVLAMTGGSINHGILCDNSYNELRSGLERNGIQCNAYGSEIRIHIEKVESIVYTDAMIICGNMEVSEKDTEAVINPLLIVEVLSKSTESYDRGEKFYKYRQLPSIHEYILINQDKPLVETFFKTEEGNWEIGNRFVGLDKDVELKCLNFQINMRKLYQNVVFKDYK